MREEEPFDDISKELSVFEFTASTHCEPIYLMRNIRGERQDRDTESATVTYVKFNGKYYALTCAHVADAREDGVESKPLLVPTVWGLSGKGFAFRAGSENSLAGEFRTFKRARSGHRRPDIAIALLSDDFIRLHMQPKGKTPLDLDKLEQLDWSLVRTCAAWGFPNNAKSSSGTVVSAALLTVILELQSQRMSYDRDEFVLASHLPESDGTSFSGLSGSAVYCLQKDGGIRPVGIVYEGSPGDSSSEKADGSFYGPSDFQINALVLSQGKFKGWLESLGLAMPR